MRTLTCFIALLILSTNVLKAEDCTYKLTASARRNVFSVPLTEEVKESIYEQLARKGYVATSESIELH